MAWPPPLAALAGFVPECAEFPHGGPGSFRFAAAMAVRADSVDNVAVIPCMVFTPGLVEQIATHPVRHVDEDVRAANFRLKEIVKRVERDWIGNVGVVSFYRSETSGCFGPNRGNPLAVVVAADHPNTGPRQRQHLAAELVNPAANRGRHLPVHQRVL